MSIRTQDIEKPGASSASREALERSARLHWLHWAVVALSSALTFGAWYVSSSSIEDKARIRFERERDQLVDLVLERMQKYRDALGAGVAYVATQPQAVQHDEWRRYASRLGIERQYPGINGIGAIWPVARDELDAWLAEQRRSRPDFAVKPHHDVPELLPIVYVEPVETNSAAVGLDMAFETNRYSAARLARATGKPQITGPIVLVQDEEKTPGFLFFEPWYRGASTTEAEREANFAGIIYAPFIVKKLMDGVLERSNRDVTLRLFDGDELLFADRGLHEDPQYRDTLQVDLFGRAWRFEIQSDAAFHAAAQSAQPLTILLGGILVDLLLLTLFVGLTRSSRRALALADRMTSEVRASEARLRTANEELTHFSYRTSHDLVAPLRTIRGFAHEIKEDVLENEYGRIEAYAERVDAQALRLAEVVEKMHQLHRADHLEDELTHVSVGSLVDDIRENLDWMLRSSGAELVKPDPDVAVVACRARLEQCIENLVSNAIKYSGGRADPRVEVHARLDDDGTQIIEVRDNGIGIDVEYQSRVFEMFVRVGGTSVDGSGLGLYLVRKHVERMGGRVTVDSRVGEGSCFRVELPQPIEVVHDRQRSPARR